MTSQRQASSADEDRFALLPEGSAPAAAYVVAIRPLSYFKASECVDHGRVLALAERISAQRCWSQPMPVEATTGLVMDGNHRLQAARVLGLRHLPCVPLHYGDSRLSVACWRTGRPFDLNAIWAVVQQQRVLPFKTTRHRFDPPLPATQIDLELLMWPTTQIPFQRHRPPPSALGDADVAGVPIA